MAVSKINTIFYLSNNYQNRPQNFGNNILQPDKDKSDIDRPYQIKKLSDDEIRYVSALEPNQRFFNVSKNVFKALMAIPVIDVAASTVVKRGNLSSKMLKGTKIAAIWLGAFAAGTAVSKIKNAVNSRSEFFDRVNKEHPFLSTMVDFAAIYTAFAGILTGAKIIKNKFAGLFPSLTEKLSKGVKNPLKNLINKSVINKKLVVPAENYLEKHPHLSKTNKLFALSVVPVLFAGVLARYINEAIHRDTAAKENYNFLRSINDLIPDSETVK